MEITIISVYEGRLKS